MSGVSPSGEPLDENDVDEEQQELTQVPGLTFEEPAPATGHDVRGGDSDEDDPDQEKAAAGAHQGRLIEQRPRRNKISPRLSCFVGIVVFALAFTGVAAIMYTVWRWDFGHGSELDPDQVASRFGWKDAVFMASFQIRTNSSIGNNQTKTFVGHYMLDFLRGRARLDFGSVFSDPALDTGTFHATLWNFTRTGRQWIANSRYEIDSYTNPTQQFICSKNDRDTTSFSWPHEYDLIYLDEFGTTGMLVEVLQWFSQDVDSNLTFVPGWMMREELTQIPLLVGHGLAPKNQSSLDDVVLVTQYVPILAKELPPYVWDTPIQKCQQQQLDQEEAESQPRVADNPFPAWLSDSLHAKCPDDDPSDFTSLVYFLQGRISWSTCSFPTFTAVSNNRSSDTGLGLEQVCHLLSQDAHQRLIQPTMFPIGSCSLHSQLLYKPWELIPSLLPYANDSSSSSWTIYDDEPDVLCTSPLAPHSIDPHCRVQVPILATLLRCLACDVQVAHPTIHLPNPRRLGGHPSSTLLVPFAAIEDRWDSSFFRSFWCPLGH